VNKLPLKPQVDPLQITEADYPRTLNRPERTVFARAWNARLDAHREFKQDAEKIYREYLRQCPYARDGRTHRWHMVWTWGWDSAAVAICEHKGTSS
jgi:hypothetical protein